MMASLSPVVSPSNASNLSNQLPSRGRVPSQSSVAQSVSRASSTSQLVSPRYVRQCQDLLDHQRQVFDEERALWQLERSELHQQIARLEETLHQRLPSSQIMSPTNGNVSSSSTASRSGNLSTTGDEFWRGAGGKNDVHPTRVFSPAYVFLLQTTLPR